MSEPCSFTAFVRMTPAAFSSILRAKTLEPLAEAIARSVTDGSRDVVVFTYLKKEQALFVYCYFYYAQPLEDLLARPCLVAILQASRAKDIAGVDRAVISHDAHNFTASAPSAGFSITEGACVRDDAFDADTIARFDSLQARHFFKIADTLRQGAGHGFNTARIVDPKLRRKVERKLEARRLRIARDRLPLATPLDPVRLFEGYHFNGHFLLWRGAGALVPLTDVDPYTLVSTGYGAADADHVVVAGHVIQTEPARFKVLGGQAATFHVCPQGVYNHAMVQIQGADPATFAVHGAYGRDRFRWYRRDGEPIDDVGEEARVDERLYFLPLILLLGNRSVYLGDSRLPVEGASCEVVRAQPLRRDPWFGALLWLRDANGEHVVSRWWRVGEDATPVVWPSADPDAAWVQAEAAWQALVVSADPSDALRVHVREARQEGADAAVYIDVFEAWAARHLATVWRDDPYNSFFWEGVEHYLALLGRTGQAARVLAFYDSVKTEAWRWPSVFVHTTMACLAQGRVEDALAHTRLAARTSHHVAAQLLAVPDIQALLARDDAADLKALAAYLHAHPGGKATLPGQLAVHWLDVIPDRHKLNAIQQLFAQFEIPGAAVLQSLRSLDAERAALCETAYVRFLNASLLDPRTRPFPAYDARSRYAVWGELPGLHPAAHLIAAASLYSEGLFWLDQGAQGQRQEFALAELAQRRASTLGAQAPWIQDADWLRLSADPLYAPFLGLAGNL